MSVQWILAFVQVYLTDIYPCLLSVHPHLGHLNDLILTQTTGLKHHPRGVQILIQNTQLGFCFKAVSISQLCQLLPPKQGIKGVCHHVWQKKQFWMAKKLVKMAKQPTVPSIQGAEAGRALCLRPAWTTGQVLGTRATYYNPVESLKNEYCIWKIDKDEILKWWGCWEEQWLGSLVFLQWIQVEFLAPILGNSTPEPSTPGDPTLFQHPRALACTYPITQEHIILKQ